MARRTTIIAVVFAVGCSVNLAADTPPAPVQPPASPKLAAANALATGREYRKAVDAYSAVLSEDRKSVDALRGRAAARLELSAVDAALADAEAAMRLRPHDVAVLVTLAEARLARAEARNTLADAVHAIAVCDLALGLDPKCAAAHAVRAAAWGFHREFDRALADCEAALRLEPKSARAYRARGNVHLQKRTYDRARQDYTTAIELDPQSPWGWLGRAMLHLELRDREASLNDVEAAIRVAPELADPLTVRAVLRIEIGRADDAKADLAAALRLNPDDPLPVFVPAALHVADADPRPWMADLDRLIARRPDDGAAWLVLALCHAALAEYDLAIVAADHAARLNRLDPLPHTVKAGALAEKGEWSRSAAAVAAALAIDPDEPLALILRAQLRFNRGEVAAAIADLEKAARIPGYAAEARLSLGFHYLQRKQPALALPELTRAVDADPRDPAALAARAVARDRVGQADQAAADFKAAVALGPVAAFRGRADALQACREEGRAIADLDEVLKRRPNDTSALLARGGLYTQRRERTKALADLDSAVRLVPRSSEAYIRRVAAHAPTDKAKIHADLEAALRIDPDSSSAKVYRAAFRVEAQQYGLALAECDDLLQADPDHPAARITRAHVYLAHSEAEAPLNAPLGGQLFQLTRPPAGTPARIRAGSLAPERVGPPAADERFADPGASGFAKAVKDYPEGFQFADGRLRVRAAPGGWRGWGLLDHKESLVCEVVGRLPGGVGADGWGVFLAGRSKPNRLLIRVRADGRVEVRSAPGAEPKAVFSSSLSPPVSAVAGGAEFRTLRVVLRGSELEVYLDNRAVFGTMLIPTAFTPAFAGVLAYASDVADRSADFSRYTVWAGAPPSLPVGHTPGTPVTAVAFSPDGRQLASGGGESDRSVCVWDLTTRSQIARFTDLAQPIAQVAFRPDGQYLLARGTGGAVCSWSLATGRLAARFDARWGTCLALSDDATRAVTVVSGGHLQVWDLPPNPAAEPKPRGRFKGHPSGVDRAFLFSAGECVLSVGSQDNCDFRIWGADSGKERRVQPRTAGWESPSVAGFSSDGQFAYISDHGGKGIQKYSLTVKDSPILWPGSGGDTRAMVVTRLGELALVAGHAAPLRVFRTDTGETVDLAPVGGTPTRSVAVTLDGRWAATGNAAGGVSVWRLPLTVEQALADTESVRHTTPESEAGHLMRGICLMRAGWLDLALAAFGEAIRIEPNAADAYCHRALIWKERNNPDKALADLNQAIDAEPKHAEAFYLRGLIYTDKGEFAKAKRDLDTATRLNPELAKLNPGGRP